MLGSQTQHPSEELLQMDIFIGLGDGQIYPWEVRLEQDLAQLKDELIPHWIEFNRSGFTQLRDDMNSIEEKEMGHENYISIKLFDPTGQNIKDIKEINSGDTLKLVFQEKPLPFEPHEIEKVLEELNDDSVFDCQIYPWRDGELGAARVEADPNDAEEIEIFWAQVDDSRKRQAFFARKIEKHYRANNRRKLRYYLHACQALNVGFIDLLWEGQKLNYRLIDHHVDEVWNLNAPLHRLLRKYHPKEDTCPHDPDSDDNDYYWKITFPQYDVLSESEDEDKV